MDRDPLDVSQRHGDRFEAARLEFDAQLQRFEQAQASLQETIDRMQRDLPQREMLRHSAFARLQARLDTMPVIEQAKGVLMAQQHCGPDEAFDLLRRASQRANVKLHVLAEQIVAHVSSPTPPADSGADVRQSTSAG
jgi:hypothetical protein